MDNGHVCMCCLLHILLHTLRGKWNYNQNMKPNQDIDMELGWIKATVCLFLVQG
jgi:hypothetical protein